MHGEYWLYSYLQDVNQETGPFHHVGLPSSMYSVPILSTFLPHVLPPFCTELSLYHQLHWFQRNWERYYEEVQREDRMERVRRDQEETSEDQNVLRGEGVSILRKAFGWGEEWMETSLSWRGSVRGFYYLQGQEDRRKEKYRIMKIYFCINSLHYSFSTCFSPVCSQIRVFISFLAIKSLPLRDSLLQVVLTPPASG